MKTKILLFFAMLVMLSIAGIAVWNEFGLRVLGKAYAQPAEEEIGNTDSNLGKVQLLTITQQIPDQAFFDMLFNTVLSMENAATKLRSEGKSGDIWSKYFARKGGLTEPQISELRQAAKDFEREMVPIQQRAMTIIGEQRAALSNGKPLPTPLEDLKRLQEKREQIALKHGDRLQKRLGMEVISKLRNSLRQNTNNLQPLNDSERQELKNEIKRSRREMFSSPKSQKQEDQGNE